MESDLPPKTSSMTNQPQLSIVVPVYNEAESLPELREEIAKVCETHEIAYEILFIDDGSTDASWHTIDEMTDAYAGVRGIRFRRNFGKAAGLKAGFQAANGKYILMIDADLQDDPAEIPVMLAKMEEGFDVVNGWKEHRLDPWHKVYPSKVFNGLVGKLTGLKLHDHNCGLKLMKREVTDELHLYGELHRFIPVMADARGYRVTELPVHHRTRKFGSSKYGGRRFARGFLDLLTVRFLTGYGQRPLHLLGMFGILFLMLGIAGIGFLSLIWVLTNVFSFGFAPIGSRPLLAYSIAFTILGAQAISLGLIAELLVSIAGKTNEPFSIRERRGFNGDE